MRIIAGKCKGTRLVVAQKDTRPSSDRLKGSLFNSLFKNCSNQIWLDLYAGSGAIGLEALSRNAKHVFFNDQSKEAYKSIKANIEKCHMNNQSSLYHMDAVDMIRMLNNQKREMDVIFLDPPYEFDIQHILDELRNSFLIKKGTILVIEQKIKADPYSFDESYMLLKEKNIGQSVYRAYEKGN
jgi:16S rRNA (guanine966-N2)-methyltransferase